MTPSLVIEVNRTALLRLVAWMFEASGLVPGQPAFLSRGIRGTVLYHLRPMEAAARRLIFARAKGLVVKLRKARGKPTRPIPRGRGARVPSFPLFDPRLAFEASGRRKTVKGAGPRILFLDGSDPTIAPVDEADTPAPDAPVDATRLCNRLQALKAALEDLPKQARRMARAQARRKLAPPGPKRAPPLRPGRPPGHRARGRFEVDEILRECHRLAMMDVVAPDTS